MAVTCMAVNTKQPVYKEFQFSTLNKETFVTKFCISSLHYVIFFSFCSFSYSGVCSDQLKLSFYDIIVVKHSCNGDRIEKL